MNDSISPLDQSVEDMTKRDLTTLTREQLKNMSLEIGELQEEAMQTKNDIAWEILEVFTKKVTEAIQQSQ